ncbi:protein YIPF [Chloropicon primus]|uniref:Protein YIP n=1 Tax=Chloropicon primus TaxID=1764295 RepID=A0A5B8MUE1_9CHLO|nr:hypothetical protein A3770_11p64590 [Chloropicon primus]UPR03152.1 protein YIPF [Chloropicon primus]|eukprot:QDZ23941.1 hypothetical protein A3770_11p64590 [Chloropicon primus]
MQSNTDSPFASGGTPVVPDDGTVQMFTEEAEPGTSELSAGQRTVPAGSTLNESVWQTLKRDLLQIALNLRIVLVPVSKQTTAVRALREWDLWGPMIFSISLALLLSHQSDSPAKAFSIVFCVLTVGAAVLTLNVILLGGKIVFLQACSLLGYCTFPLLVAAMLTFYQSMKVVKLLVMLLGVAWASWAAVPFVSASVSPKRKMLAVYPLMMMYLFLSWVALTG